MLINGKNIQVAEVKPIIKKQLSPGLVIGLAALIMWITVLGAVVLLC